MLHVIIKKMKYDESYNFDHEVFYKKNSSVIIGQNSPRFCTHLLADCSYQSNDIEVKLPVELRQLPACFETPASAHSSQTQKSDATSSVHHLELCKSLK